MNAKDMNQNQLSTGIRSERIRLDQIDRKDKRFQIRAGLNQDKLAEYVKLVKTAEGVEAFASRPELWLREDGSYVCIDGAHRIEAAAQAGKTEFDVMVFEGSEQQALLRAMAANLNHGIPLTVEEKRQACLRTIEALKPIYDCHPANTWVAEVLHVSEAWVRITCNKLIGLGKLDQPTEVVDKNGNRQAAKKTGKRQEQSQQAAAGTPTRPDSKPATKAHNPIQAQDTGPKTTTPAPAAKTVSPAEQGKGQPKGKREVKADSPDEVGSAVAPASDGAGSGEDSRIRALRDIVPVVQGLASSKEVLDVEVREAAVPLVRNLVVLGVEFLGEENRAEAAA